MIQVCKRLGILKLVLAPLLVMFVSTVYAQDQHCKQHIQKHIDNPALLQSEALQLQGLIEESLGFREGSIVFAQELKARYRGKQPFSGQDLKALNEGLIHYLNLRKKLLYYATAHECWLDENTAFEGIRKSGALKLKGVLLSLASALTLYDNYLLAVSIYEEDDKLRRFLNSGDSGYQKQYAELAAVTDSYNSIANRSRVRRLMRFYEKSVSDQIRNGFTDKYAYLEMLIRQSPSYKLTRKYRPFYVLKRKIKFMDAITSDSLVSLRNEGVNLFSMVFGNAVGLVESRKGKLFNNAHLRNAIHSRLKAGDILLEKTPFRLTDRLIPGHWGHVAIWVGDESELRQLGIWHHPVVRQYHQQIRSGKLVVEALRRGVVMRELKHFMNIDDFSALRLRKSKGKLGEIIVMALRQVGKAYDFNFDVETTDRIVCSELVYTAYTNISWPTENTLGRHTISPDNVANKVLSDGPLKVIMLIHDGEILKPDLTQQMKNLLSKT